MRLARQTIIEELAADKELRELYEADANKEPCITLREMMLADIEEAKRLKG